MSTGHKLAVHTPIVLEQLEGSHPNHANEAPARKTKDGGSWLQQEAHTESCRAHAPHGKGHQRTRQRTSRPHAEKHLQVTSCEGRALCLWLLLPREAPLGTVTPGLRHSRATLLNHTGLPSTCQSKGALPPGVLDMLADVPPPPLKPSTAPRRVSS